MFSISWILLHLLAVVMLATARRRDSLLLLVAAGIGLYIVLSAAWSVAVTESLVHGAMAAGNIAVAYLLAMEKTPGQIVRLFLRVLLVLTIAGLAAAAVGYGQVLDYDPHARENFLGGERLRGFFPHNIMAGFYGAIGLALALTLLRGLRRASAAALFALWVLLTGSATGLALKLLAAAAVPAARLLVPRVSGTALLVVAGPAGLALGLLTWHVWEPMVQLLGRDPTMTGRTVLWEWGMDAIAERPVGGWGFNAYFHSGYGAEPSLYVPEFNNYEIAHFHNSFIQTAVDLGIVGLLILLAVLSCATCWAYLYVRGADRRTGMALLMVMVIFAVASPTEFLFFNYNQFAMFALFTIFFALARARRGPHRDSDNALGSPRRRRHRSLR